MTFTAPETWHGGYYELALELGPRSDERLLTALHTLWAQPALTGPYLHRERESADQQRVSPTRHHLSSGQHLLGVAQLPEEVQVACGSVPVRQSDDVDWLTFYIPMGALETVYDIGGFPFDGENHRAWRQPLETWLAEMGKAIYRRAPFRLGLIGHEVSGITDTAEIASYGLPTQRRIGYLYVVDGQLLYAPTQAW